MCELLLINIALYANLLLQQDIEVYNHGNNIVGLFDVYQIFRSPQVKRSTIISNKQGVYELPKELPNDLRLTILGNEEKSEKPQNLLEL